MTVTLGEKTGFYVYVLFRADGRPFYIGKGTRRRWLVHEEQSKHQDDHKARIIRQTIEQLGCLPKVKVRENLTEREAFETEVALIAVIGRGDRGPLINLTDGGEGTYGHKFGPLSDAHKLKISRATKGLKRSDEFKAKVSAQKKGGTLSVEHRAKISASTKGRVKTPEEVERCAASHRGKKRSAEARRNISLGKRGTKLAPEHADAKRRQILQMWADPAFRERMREIHLQRWAKKRELDAANPA